MEIGLRLCSESGRFRVSGRIPDLSFDDGTEFWIPSSERIFPFLVKDARSDLKQKVCSALAPPHVLTLYHPLADNLVDS